MTNHPHRAKSSAVAAHTPTPWTTDRFRTVLWVESGACWVARCLYPEDAAFIVRAVNAHDELVAALKGLLAANGGGVKLCGHDYDCICAVDGARAALAAAEGVSNG